MTASKQYRQGVPCWVDLWTKDRPAAMEFYAAVFGWEYEVGPQDQHHYTTVRTEGSTVGGMVTPPGNENAPVAWITYLAADNVDAVVSAAVEHGGRSLTGVIQVPGGDGVRIAVLADPTGAVFGAWQAPGNRAAEAVNEPGSIIRTS
jgi:predicted enzyme related to lactoylglutathione lyase